MYILRMYLFHALLLGVLLGFSGKSFSLSLTFTIVLSLGGFVAALTVLVHRVANDAVRPLLSLMFFLLPGFIIGIMAGHYLFP